MAVKLFSRSGGAVLRRLHWQIPGVSCGEVGRVRTRRCAAALSNDSHQKGSSTTNFQFSRSGGHPKNLDLNENLYPGFQKAPGKVKVILARTLRFALPVIIGFAFYYAFTSEYDLEVEEKLKETLPGYEEAMQTNPNYVEALETLKQKRLESSSKS